MSEIEIQQPISLKMSLLETEDLLQSMLLSLEIEIPHGSANYAYRVDNLWFTCDNWDSFILGWKNPSTEYKTVLKDMSEQFFLSIEKKKSEGILVGIRSIEPDLGIGKTELNSSIKMLEDQVGILKREFENFPKWW